MVLPLGCGSGPQYHRQGEWAFYSVFFPYSQWVCWVENWVTICHIHPNIDFHLRAKTRGMHAPTIIQALFNPDFSSLHEIYATNLQHGPLLSLQVLKFNVSKLKQALKIKSHPTALLQRLLPPLPVARVALMRLALICACVFTYICVYTDIHTYMYVVFWLRFQPVD